MPADPTIPRQRGDLLDPRGRTGWPTVGWLLEGPTGIVLEAENGSIWPLSMVSFRQGTYGGIDNSEGVSKLPRVRRVRQDGTVIVSGDRLLVEFLDGNIRRPVVVGGVRGLRRDDFLPYNHTAPGATENRLAGRLRPRTVAGDTVAEHGEITWELCRDDDASVRLRIVDGAGKASELVLTPTELTLAVPTGGVIRLASASASSGFVLDPLLTDLQVWTQALTTFMGTTSGAATAGVIATAAGTFLAATATTPLPARLGTSLASGAPYLSTRIKGE